MSFFVRATPAPTPKTANVRAVSLLAAAIIIAMAVAQLFRFEDFPALLTLLWLPGGEVMVRVVAALLVVVEVLALPFLLSMQLSPLFRVISMVCGWLTALAWLKLTLWENLVLGDVSLNSGLLGAAVPLPVGWWSVCFSVALAALLGWAAWGMWPSGGKTLSLTGRRRSIRKTINKKG